MSEEGFLRAIQEAPRDDAQLLIYADWLLEQCDPVAAKKAEFLRLTVKWSGRKGWRKVWLKQLQPLAAELDTNWLAVVSRVQIERCHAKRYGGATAVPGHRLPIRFSFLCDRRWEDLQGTDDRAVRFCDSCQQNVHFCDTITEARQQAQEGHCIAVDLGVIRRDRDLEPPMGMYLGRVSPEFLRQEEERLKPDPVSAERERRKRHAEPSQP